MINALIRKMLKLNKLKDTNATEILAIENITIASFRITDWTALTDNLRDFGNQLVAHMQHIKSKLKYRIR